VVKGLERLSETSTFKNGDLQFFSKFFQIHVNFEMLLKKRGPVNPILFSNFISMSMFIEYFSIFVETGASVRAKGQGHRSICTSHPARCTSASGVRRKAGIPPTSDR
jgi:hypothetical protein